MGLVLPGTNSPLKGEQLRRLDNAQSAELADRLTASWHPSLKPVFECQDRGQTSILRLLLSPSDIPPWEADARVTLLGDAVHTMIPAAASGANTAMRDAGLLVQLIRDKGLGREVIAKYEEEMRKYAGETVALSAKIGQMSFGQRPLDEYEVAAF